MTIEFRDNKAALISELKAMIAEMDTKSQQAAEQILIEGKNVATSLCLKDTGALQDSIESSSKVTKISPCIYNITLSNSVDYGAAQEFGPQSGKRKWRFRPHIRPGWGVMMAKSQECIERVFG